MPHIRRLIVTFLGRTKAQEAAMKIAARAPEGYCTKAEAMDETSILMRGILRKKPAILMENLLGKIRNSICAGDLINEDDVINLVLNDPENECFLGIMKVDRFKFVVKMDFIKLLSKFKLL